MRWFDYDDELYPELLIPINPIVFKSDEEDEPLELQEVAEEV